MKLKELKEIPDDEWKQNDVIHCIDVECSGMLLENDLCYEMKCSKCGKFWIPLTKWIEIDE